MFWQLSSFYVQVNGETGRIKLSLKQSLCFSTDVSFIRGYLAMEEKVGAISIIICHIQFEIHY